MTQRVQATLERSEMKESCKPLGHGASLTTVCSGMVLSEAVCSASLGIAKVGTVYSLVPSSSCTDRHQRKPYLPSSSSPGHC
jgi:hypothetical protein